MHARDFPLSADRQYPIQPRKVFCHKSLKHHRDIVTHDGSHTDLDKVESATDKLPSVSRADFMVLLVNFIFLEDSLSADPPVSQKLEILN